MKRGLGICAGILVAFYAVAFVYLYFNQRNLEYAPSKIAFENCSYGEKVVRGPELRWLHINSSEANEARAVAEDSVGSQTPIHFVFFHGNAYDACERGKVVVNALASLKGNIDLIEYPGFAESGTEPSEEKILAAARGWIEAIRDDAKSKNEKLLFLGESLGTGVATYASTLIDNDGLVLFSPYTSVLDVAQDRYPIFPIHWLMQDTYFANEWAKQTKSKKVLVFHGALDTTIPVEIGEAQVKNFSVPTQYIRYPDRKHSLLKDNNDLWQRVRAFASN